MLAPFFVVAFVGAFSGAFGGVVAARVVGAWTVRRTFERMRAAATTSRAAVPRETTLADSLVDPPESDCG